jgi:hypothetical protein
MFLLGGQEGGKTTPFQKISRGHGGTPSFKNGGQEGMAARPLSKMGVKRAGKQPSSKNGGQEGGKTALFQKIKGHAPPH